MIQEQKYIHVILVIFNVYMNFQKKYINKDKFKIMMINTINFIVHIAIIIIKLLKIWEIILWQKH